jgi:carboxymethylenebutenolidase
VQVGLLDPATLPVVGAEQAAKLRDPTLPSNELIRRAERERIIVGNSSS